MEIIKIKELENLLENISAKKYYSSQNVGIIKIILKKYQKIQSHKKIIEALSHIIEGNEILKI